jgi:hypothetical protein
MKLSFLPADLHLGNDQEGHFIVSLQGNEILRTTSSQKALMKFNQLKKELEQRFPSHELSPEDAAEIMRKSIADSLVGHNSWRPEERKKKLSSTRTFG